MNLRVLKIAVLVFAMLAWTASASASGHYFEADIVDYSPSNPVEGDSIQFTVDVTNTGSQQDSDFVDLYSDFQSAGSFDGHEDFDHIYELGVGETATTTLTWNTESGDAGTYDVEVVIDMGQGSGKGDTEQVVVGDSGSGGGGSAGEPRTDDNYSSSKWQNTSQAVKIECTTSATSCWTIDWRIMKNGNVLRQRQGQTPLRELTVDVGSENNGDLVLEYRGDSPPGQSDVEDWNSQRVKVDKVDPNTEIVGPNSSRWYENDITVTAKDSDQHSGIRSLDIRYVVDVSGSFQGEWQTLEDNVEDIDENVESDNATRMTYQVFANNDSWGRHFSRSVYEDVIDGTADLDNYFDFLNSRGESVTWSSYSPGSRGEDPKEGWGMSMLDVMNRGTWKNQSSKAIMMIGDHDTTGGGSCGERLSQDLTYHVENQVKKEGIYVFGMIGNEECGASSSQINVLGETSRYGSSGEMAVNIQEAIRGIQADRCHYRVNDGGQGWTEWRPRTCPDGTFDVSVGPPGTGSDCTAPGEDQCKVQIRVFDIAGNVDHDTESFDISHAIYNDTPDFDTELDPPSLGGGSGDFDNGEDGLSYTAFITTSEHPDLLPVRVRNSGGHVQQFVTSIEGEGFEFQQGGKQTQPYSLTPGESETFLVKVETEEGDRELKVTTESRTLGITETETMDVHVRNHQVRADREIPGLEHLQIAVLAVASTVAYSLLL